MPLARPYSLCVSQYGEILGRGNGGMVVAGHHKFSGLPVAIKVSPESVQIKAEQSKAGSPLSLSGAD